MANPVWVTPAGNLGNLTSQVSISPIQIFASPVYPASTVFYKLYQDELPAGLELSITGVISGTPKFVNQDTTYGFTIQAYDNLGNTSLRDFNIIVKNPNPVWVTPNYYILNGKTLTNTSLYNNVTWNLGTFPKDVVIPDPGVIVQARAPSVTATQISIGSSYTILTLNSGTDPETATDYTLIGAANNNIGTKFISGKTTSATNIVKGYKYRILTVGNTDYTLIGAANNSIGTYFTAYWIGETNPVTGTTGTVTCYAGGGTGTVYPSYPTAKLTYKIISGALPTGVELITDTKNNRGLLQGTPTDDVQSKTYTFVIRATDNNDFISDRTFSITVIGSLLPYFVTEALNSTVDSVWYAQQVEYVNPAPVLYPSTISLASGQLPPGLEINEAGLIRGYATAPTVTESYTQVETACTKTEYGSKVFTALSTAGFKVDRPIRFSGTVFGGVSEFDPLNATATTYFIKSIISSSQFTICTSIGGDTFTPSSGTGVMDIVLPASTVDTPIVKTYNFTLRINSSLSNILRNYSITVTNQNINAVGHVRIPVIYNTRPLTYNIDQDVTNYGFYVLPPGSIITGNTYPETDYAPIGKFYSDNVFAFKILGKDFDNDSISFNFNIPPSVADELTGDPNTGWVTGKLNQQANTISNYNFNVFVQKKDNTSIQSPRYYFEFTVTNNVDNNIVWVTDTDLGNIYNGTNSVLKVKATNSANLQYQLDLQSGETGLPDNLVLLSNGDIAGTVAYETTNDYADKNTVIPYTFSVKAFNPSPGANNLVESTKQFKLSVVQKFTQPTDTLYITCTPSIVDRELIYDLLNDNTLIPENYLYRPNDNNFGKANNVTYVHAYGIYSSNIAEYIAAVQIQHYNKSVVLGPLKTAIARDANNNIIYEVVYSEIIDDLVNPQGISVSKSVIWPFYIDLGLGPWYTSITDIYTSYIFPIELFIETQNKIFYLQTQDQVNLATNQGQPTFYTSLTPGYARELFPNSLDNMRKQVENVLGVDNSAALLPQWMSSQQANGSTLGFTKAWVIAYCEPGVTTLPNGTEVTYAEKIKYNIENNWVNAFGRKYTLNLINFQFDRFSVNKSLTFDYDKSFSPAAWTDLPSGVPQPNPIDSNNFQVLFPRKTILPNRTAYPKA